jgi:hypothetical protein
MKGGLLVDNANLVYHLEHECGRRPIRLNFEALPRVLAREASRLAGTVIDFPIRCLYCAHRPGEDLTARERFHAVLKRLGWSISDRPAKQYYDGHWEDKGTDLEIALDAQGMAYRKSIQAVAVVTNDADFAALFERLPLDVKGFAVGWETRMARELRSVTTPIYLEPLLPELISEILPARPTT